MLLLLSPGERWQLVERTGVNMRVFTGSPQDGVLKPAKLTSAALAAAALASSGLGASSLPPRVRPGVLVATFLGTGVVVTFVFCGVEPIVRPGVEKLSGWLADFEQIFPISTTVSILWS